MDKFETIKKILAEQLDVDESTVTSDTTIEELGADSLDLVEAIMNIEDEFGIEIDDNDVENLKTVGDFLEYISNKQ